MAKKKAVKKVCAKKCKKVCTKKTKATDSPEPVVSFEPSAPKTLPQRIYQFFFRS